MECRRLSTVSIIIFAMTALFLAGCSSSDSPTDTGGGGGQGGPYIWFVDHDAMGSGDGKSWDNAFNHPADAMAASSSGDQIWVARGVYFCRMEAGSFSATEKLVFLQ